MNNPVKRSVAFILSMIIVFELLPPPTEVFAEETGDKIISEQSVDPAVRQGDGGVVSTEPENPMGGVMTRIYRLLRQSLQLRKLSLQLR